MPAEAVLEAARSRHPVLDQRFTPIVPFLDKRIAHAKPMTFNGGTSVGTHADLWETSDLACQFLGFLACTSLRRDIFAKANAQALFCRHLSSRSDNLECATLADDSGQSHRSSVNQRYTPAAAIDAKVRFLRHHAEIAPESQFHAASDSRALYCGYDRFVQLKPRGSQRSARNFSAIAAWPGS